ncbi:MAG: hypothetical protein B6229_03275 [Spirochaetaceae bacterium 4572_7]|nr:MAG: hypothetical protein B6229_03275 [Spirochaetaceae bacterium 4572_7]
MELNGDLLVECLISAVEHGGDLTANMQGELFRHGYWVVYTDVDFIVYDMLKKAGIREGK